MIKETNVDVQMHLRQILQSIHDNPHFVATRGPKERAEMDKMLRAFIFRYLYYLISKNGEHLPLLFNATSREKFPNSLEDAINVESAAMSKNDPFYVIDDSVAHMSYKHTGRNCGRKFQIGEPIYRCKECSYDDTCVLCIHCFNPNDHVDHHVYTSICTPVNNGICDCGDKEAWHVPLHCKAEDEENDFDSDDVFQTEEMINLFEVILTELFDHFIDVFNQNIEPLPTIQKDVTMKLREMVQQGKLYERAMLLKDLAYANPYIEKQREKLRTSSPSFDESSMMDHADYTVLIYNDEYHNYTQATAALRQGIPDNKHTDLLTARIDGEGRAMLKCSHDLSAVVGGFFAVQTNGLSATLTTWSEYIHQETCKYIIAWINHCLTIPQATFQKTFRDAMGKVLCSTSERAGEMVDMSITVDKYFGNRFGEDYPYKYADLSVLDRHNTIPLSHHKVLPESETNYISPTLNGVQQPKDKHYLNSRLQKILFFDNRYWKRLRKDVQDMIIPTLASSLEFKPLFCFHLVEIFNHMTRSVAFMDREPQLTALRESVVQLFTCPTNAATIFENGSFTDIMWSVIDIFTEFCKVEGGLLIWQRVQKSNPTKSYSISFKQGLYAVETILSKIGNPNFILKPTDFISIVTLCKLFNGAWKIKRKEGEHVLREDQHFIPHLEYTTSIYSIVQTIDKVLENSRDSVDEGMLLNAIRLLNTFLGTRTLPYKIVFGSHEVVKFKVSKQRVAFMNPVHTLLSFLIEKVPLRKAFEAISACNDFLTISDFPLRSVVLCSQIDVGFWVRNGMSVLHQSSYYKKNPEMACYIRDIHLNQIAFLREKNDLIRLTYNMLDRWELLEWFGGEEDFLHTVYEDKIVHILQQFIAFVYQLLSERQSFKKFKSAEDKEYHQIKNAIIYGLYTEPLSYSSLLKAVPDYLTEITTQFDRALEEVSIYVEPRGLEDNGVFRLKQDYYKKIDPLQLLNMENDFEHSASIIKYHLAEGGKNAAKVVLQPQLISPNVMDEDSKCLGSFTRTSLFSKFIYKALQTSIDLDEGTYIYALLHLIHGILRDEELVNGHESIPDCYISKPICNLLLTIVESKSGVFSENVIAKADYLLENMIWKKPAAVLESLVACFGQNHVDAYKARKLNQGVNFEESEKEKKKRLAKARQERILAKFSRQQNKFMKENESQFANDGNDVEMTDQHGVDTLEEFTCALCQDSTSVDSFVIPVYHENSPIFRNGDIHNVQEFAKPWHGFYNEYDHPTIHDDETLENYREDGARGSKKVFVSCNHYIHYKCFKRYAQKKRFSTNSFICPLCQTFSNCVLPVCRNTTADGIMNLSGLIRNTNSEDNIAKILKTDTTEDFNNVFNMFLEINNKNMNYDRNCSASPDFQRSDVSFILAVHWANTISMVEVSTRISDHPHDDLLKGNEQKFRTLKNVLASIAWLYKVIGKPSPDHIPYINKNGVVWNQNQLFQYIVRTSLFTSSSIADVITNALSVFSKQLVVDFTKGMLPTAIEKMHRTASDEGVLFEVNESMWMSLRKVCDIGISDADMSKKLYDLAFTCLLKNILPTLRRCLIFVKVMSNLVFGDEKRVEIDEIGLESDLGSSKDLPQYVDQIIKLITTSTSLQDILLQCVATSNALNDPYLSGIPYEFTGVVKLVDLAKYLNTYVTNSKEVKLRDEHPLHMKNVDNRLDFKICLACGVKVHLRSDHTELVKHLMKHCFKPFGLFLIPNVSEVCMVLTNPRSSISISAPYLNSHGESGRNAIQRGDLTVLNLKRYEHLNRVWINNEIPGYISRIMGDEFRVSIISNGMVFNFNRNVLRRPRPTNNDGEDDESSSSEGEDDDMDGTEEMRWEFRPEDILEDDTVFRLGGAAPVQGGDIRDFFQFITNLRNEADLPDTTMEAAGENIFVPQFQIPRFRGTNPPTDDEETENNDDDLNESDA